MAVKEHAESAGRLGELMYTNPDKILPQHQYLIMVDPAELGEGKLTTKQVWISKMEAARLAKKKVDKAVTKGRGGQTDGTRTESCCG